MIRNFWLGVHRPGVTRYQPSVADTTVRAFLAEGRGRLWLRGPSGSGKTSLRFEHAPDVRRAGRLCGELHLLGHSSSVPAETRRLTFAVELSRSLGLEQLPWKDLLATCVRERAVVFVDEVSSLRDRHPTGPIRPDDEPLLELAEAGVDLILLTMDEPEALGWPRELPVTPIWKEDLDAAAVAALVAPLARSEELAAEVMAQVGGNPVLLQRVCVMLLKRPASSLADVVAELTTDLDPFLIEIEWSVRTGLGDPEARQAWIRAIGAWEALVESGPPDSESPAVDTLRRLGLLRPGAPLSAPPCGLFLSRFDRGWCRRIRETA